MKRWQQKKKNIETIDMLKKLILINRNHPHSYEVTAEQLNALGFRTSRGNLWTPQRLLRMLQRSSISGLHGLMQEMRNPNTRIFP